MSVRSKITGREWKTKDLKPSQRLESLIEKNFKPSGDREYDKIIERQFEEIYKELKKDE